MDSLIRPRPIKSGNPLIFRSQSEDVGLKPSQGTDAIPSGVSRYPSPLTDMKHFLIHLVVAVQHRYLLMPLRRQNQSLLQENKSVHNKDTEYFLLSTIMLVFRILTGKAIIEILGVSLCYFGSGWPSW